jgi:hypothetical protein
MSYYSIAVKGAGTDDPEDISVLDYEGTECPLDHCTDNRCNHHILIWQGNEYSRRNAWIAIDNDSMRELQSYR